MSSSAPANSDGLKAERAKADVSRGAGAAPDESGRRGEPRLTPEDFEVALKRMKRELALKSLRRSLRDSSLDSTAILGIVRQIVAIQEEESAATKPPPAEIWNITSRCIPVPLM